MMEVSSGKESQKEERNLLRYASKQTNKTLQNPGMPSVQQGVAHHYLSYEVTEIHLFGYNRWTL
jgi:hypothetical protein